MFPLRRGSIPGRNHRIEFSPDVVFWQTLGKRAGIDGFDFLTPIIGFTSTPEASTALCASEGATNPGGTCSVMSPIESTEPVRSFARRSNVLSPFSVGGIPSIELRDPAIAGQGKAFYRLQVSVS